MTLDPPLRFRIKPGVLRVRIARAHPGASPSASIPEDPWGGVRELARVAAGHPPHEPGRRSEELRHDADRWTPLTKERTMDVVEIEQKETVSRKEVVTRLRRLASQLAKGNDVKFDQGGMAMTVHVPDEVQLKVELEVETDGRELEIELKW